MIGIASARETTYTTGTCGGGRDAESVDDGVPDQPPDSDAEDDAAAGADDRRRDRHYEDGRTSLARGEPKHPQHRQFPGPPRAVTNIRWLIAAAGDEGEEHVQGLAATVRIVHAEPTLDPLTVNGLAGNDTIARDA